MGVIIVIVRFWGGGDWSSYHGEMFCDLQWYRDNAMRCDAMRCDLGSE